MEHLLEKYNTIFNFINSEKPFTPETAIILGSGLGDFADCVNTVKTISTSSIPGYPVSTVEGHKGFIHFAEFENRKLILFQGRIHFYEGYELEKCIIPVLIAKAAGCKNLLLSNAAGGINPFFRPGNLMLIESFNAINLKKELASVFSAENSFYTGSSINHSSLELNEKIKKSAIEESLDLKTGSYWFCKGPSYETPSEVKMIGRMGGDAVGMSTVHEMIAGMKLGLETAAISCITNFAAGISPNKLDHKEVMEIADSVKPRFEKLIKSIIVNI